MADRFTYLMLRAGALLIRFVPFGLLYAFSDALYYLIFYIIKYRRHVVRQNLESSFPEKSPAEIRQLTRKFYHHLTDIFLESIKGLSMSKAEIVKRHKLINPELADAYYNIQQTVISLPAHYNNWEWGSLSPGLQIKFPVVAFYKPLSNRYNDAYINRHRAAFRTQLASIKNTKLTFEKFAGTPVAYIMAADQSPSNLRDCYWTDFLNHDTACLHGPEKYARLYNYPVLFVDIRKVKRGFYELELVPLTDNPAAMPDGEITRLYMQHLERSIHNEPAYWLWSHRRWKHSR